MFEDFLNALANFRRQKMRTTLSVLGVIIGVASVIVIMSMGQSSTKQIQDTFGNAGLDMVNISGGFMRRSRDAVSLQFNENFRENLFANVRNIKKIWYKNSLSATISFGETSVNGSCEAVETGYLEAYSMQLESGRFFSVTENLFGAQKIILGKEYADLLFPSGDGVGKKVLVTADKISFGFEVVGILKEQNTGMENSSSATYIPRGFYAKKITPNPEAATIMVQAVSNEFSTQLVNDITEYCKELTGTEGSVWVNSMQTMIEQMNKITNSLSVMLAAIAAISLLVGGIGIMNIMIVTVTERRQEIGIRKALGASPNIIRRQFLIESAAITVMGGIAGIAFGILITLALEYVRSLSFTVSTTSCFISFFFSVFVGIIFGFSPASRAAKLDPVDALNGE